MRLRAIPIMRRPLLWAAGASLLLLLWLSFNALSASRADAARAGDKVGPGVQAALETDGSAQVVIALADPARPAAYAGDLAAWTAQVAALQEQVLTAVGPADFALKDRYRAVPALSGVLLSSAGLSALAAHPAVARVDLDVGGGGALGDSVPFIGADTWHDAGVDGDGVVVAVLDTGLDTDHDDLAAGLIHQACFLDGDGSINGVGFCPNGSDRQFGPGAAEDDAGHGTHVTGIVGSRGNVSDPGVAPGARIVALKVMHGPPFAGVFYNFSEIVAALDYLITDRPDVRVINMSFLTFATFAGPCDSATSWLIAGATAINILRANGVTAFAASGNDGSGTHMGAPACLSNVLAVGATDLTDTVATFTSSNNMLDLMAPGVNIVSSGMGNTTFIGTGTSMASPHAAGCAALLLDAGVLFTPDQVEARLEDSPFQVTDPTNGLTFPRIDCAFSPITAVNLTGPATGLPGMSHSFQAAALPGSASTPVLYNYAASDQPPISHSAGLSDSVSYTWNTPGVKSVTVSAHNGGATAGDTVQITIYDPAQLSIPWWTADGGGGVSSGGDFRLTGTAGQPDAQSPAAGGDFTLAGGFWRPAPVMTPLYLPVMLK